MLPALYERGDVGEVFMRPSPASLNGDDQDWLDFVDIRADAKLRGIISGRYNSGLRAQDKFDELREATVGVIEAVDRHWAGQ